jgi:hypothetical protein
VVLLPTAARNRLVIIASFAALCVGLPSAAAARAAAASLFLSPSGSDSNPCTQAAPCRSVDRGYRVAQPGQTVELAAGSYGAQSIALDGSKTSSTDVVFRPVAGASATLGWTEIRSSHITFENLRFADGWRTWNGVSDFTFRSTSGRKMMMYGTREVSVLGGDYGPSHNEYSFISSPGPGQGDPASILIDGVRFHDYTRDAGRHTECLHVAAANGITIRNSRFERCAVMDLFFTLNVNSASAPSSVLLENNFFGPPVGGYYSVLFDHDYDANGQAIPWRNVTVRHNSFGHQWTIESGSNAVTNVTVSANAGVLANCRAGVAYSRNVWQGRSCGASDRNVASTGFRDAAALDYHLAAGSPAIDAGDAGSFPAMDIDGHTRFAGAAPDAGADEYGSSAASPPPAPPAPPPPAPTAPAAGLVAAYGFDEGRGRRISDASGGGNRGNVSGAVWTKGRYGMALAFDGRNDRALVPDADSLDLRSAMTVEAWVRPAALAGRRPVLTKEASRKSAYSLYASIASKRPAGYAASFRALGRERLRRSRWTHLAATYNGARLRLYVNGARVSSRRLSRRMVSSRGPLAIGGRVMAKEWFKGRIDEVRVYSRPLSRAEIRRDMRTAINGGARPAGLPRAR